MRLFALLLTSLALLCSPALASTDDDLSRDLALAGHVFPYACHEAHPLVQVATETMLDGLDAYTDIGGDAGCWIVLNAAWTAWPAQVLCRVVIHEVGHLAGLQHSPNIRSIMYPNAKVSRARVCRYP